MKKGLSELIFILDRSGSMSSLKYDVIGGFNSLIEKQKQEEGEAYVSTILFDTNIEKLHDHIDIKEITPMTIDEYEPMGMTALLDAIGITIDSAGKRLSETPEDERPEKVIIAITTDGEENSSREYTKAQIKEKIEHQQNKYSWTFIFLGANMDAIDEAVNLGIDANFASTWTTSAAGLYAHAEGLSNAVSNLRTCDCSITCDAAINAIKSIDISLESSN